MTDSVLDDLFHFCALRAYMEIYAQSRLFPPDSETTRRLAYQYYEAALAEKNRRKKPEDSGRSLGAKLIPRCEAPEGGGKTAGCQGLTRTANCARIEK